MGKRYFSPITCAVKNDKVNRQIGVRDFENVDYFFPRSEVT